MYRPIVTALLALAAVLPLQAETINVVDSDYPPFTYEKDKVPSGFAIELLQEMAKRSDGVDLKIAYYPFKRAVALSTTEKNALITCMSKNEERNKVYQWVGPIYTTTINLYRLKDRPELQITSIDGAKDKTIGTGAGHKIVDELVKMGIPRKQIEDVSPESLNIKKLFSKRIDYVALNDWVFSYMLTQEKHTYAEVEKVIALDGKEGAAATGKTIASGSEDDSAAYYAVQKDTDPAMVAKLQASLEAMRKDGTYDTIMKKYFQ